ncbi:MAG: DUF177 domain-containing protein [Prevotella sp.]|nr:DUF177 domain-containing protein [Prevotella sp.]MCM1074872.1 DUF177 domain-containing protein [Ruminococcus sp.]
MNVLKTYKLPLAALPQGVSERDYVLLKDFFEAMEQDEVLDADVKVHLRIDAKNDVYYLHFIGEGSIDIPCDRCLDPMAHEVSFDELLTVKYGPEFDDGTDGVLVIPETDTELDLAPLLCDFTLLTIPMRHVHNVGECNAQMQEVLNEHTVYGTEDEEDDNEQD